MNTAKITPTLDIREQIHAQFSSNEHIKIAKAEIKRINSNPSNLSFFG